MQRLRTNTAGTALFLGVVLSVCLMGAPAFAWDVSKSTNGLVVIRESSDPTSTPFNVYQYFDYKGGDTASAWAGAYVPNYVSSYNKSRQVAAFSIGALGEAIEIPLHPDWRYQMVLVSATNGTNDRSFAVINEPLRVAVSNAVTASVSSMPSVAISGVATVTLDETLTVNPWSSAGLPDGWITFLAVANVVSLGGGVAAWVMRPVG